MRIVILLLITVALPIAWFVADLRGGILGRRILGVRRPTSMSPILESVPRLRFPIAVVVAFAASIATVVTLSMVAVITRMTSDSSPVMSAVFTAIFNLLVGLVGVFAGSRCLAPAERALGSLILVVLGIGFEVLMLGWAHEEFHFPRGAIGTGIGGCFVVGFHIWHKRHLPNDAA